VEDCSKEYFILVVSAAFVDADAGFLPRRDPSPSDCRLLSLLWPQRVLMDSLYSVLFACWFFVHVVVFAREHAGRVCPSHDHCTVTLASLSKLACADNGCMHAQAHMAPVQRCGRARQVRHMR
jgi:hypothetical protein